MIRILSAAIAVALLAAAPAAARTGRCLGDGTGPVCHFWTGKVKKVDDGDTIDVDIDGDGSRRIRRIRFIDVQAMEQTVYSFKHPKRRRGECHALEATARLEQLIRASHWRVRLSAQDPASRMDVAHERRLARSVAVRVRGRWEDVGAKLMSEGHTLWMAAIVETAWNARYNRLMQEAALRHVGIWNPTHCGRGPGQDVSLRLWVSWDPVGADVDHINGEWIKVQNQSPTASISLARWWVRDSMHRRFTFPSGIVLGPGETATVYAGHGQTSGNNLFWGLDKPPFQNPGDDRHLGDGGYLFDPQGDLRASMVYPCVVACSDPNLGAIEVRAQPRGREFVTFANVSGHQVDLYGYAMALHGSTYAFGPDSVLAPGQSLRVYVEGDPGSDTRFERHWGVDRLMLPDGGGAVRLATFSDVTLACDSWGSGAC